MLGVTQHPIQGGVEILLVASCNRNWDELQPDGPLGSYADFSSLQVWVFLWCSITMTTNREFINSQARDKFPGYEYRWTISKFHCACLKASLSVTPFLWKWLWFAWKWNCIQNSLSYEGFALKFLLKHKHKRTKKWLNLPAWFGHMMKVFIIKKVQLKTTPFCW